MELKGLLQKKGKKGVDQDKAETSSVSAKKGGKRTRESDLALCLLTHLGSLAAMRASRGHHAICRP